MGMARSLCFDDHAPEAAFHGTPLHLAGIGLAIIVPPCLGPPSKQNGPGHAARAVRQPSLPGYQANWFIVLCAPPALSAASPAKYSLWSSPMSDPAMFWCRTQAMPWRISCRCTPIT